MATVQPRFRLNVACKSPIQPQLWIRGGFPTDQGFDSIGLRRLSLKPGSGEPPQWRWISQRSTAVSMTSAKCLPIGKRLAGKLYADKGYIGRELFHKLWRRGLHLITSIRRNMRNYLMPLADKIMLRKRFVIETVLDTLKSEMGLEHSRHRSVINAMVHVLSCLIAYAFRPGKPSISLTKQQITDYS